MKTNNVYAYLLMISLAGCSDNKSVNPSEAPSHSSQEETEHQGFASISDDESKKTVLQIAIESPQHKTLVEAVKRAELVDVLAAVGPYTVFAPVDEAFKLLPAGTLDELLKPENKTKLQNILQYHVAPGIFTNDKLKNGITIGVANGGKVVITEKDGKKFVNDAEIIGVAEGSNGNVFVVNKVLLPQ